MQESKADSVYSASADPLMRSLLAQYCEVDYVGKSGLESFWLPSWKTFKCSGNMLDARLLQNALRTPTCLSSSIVVIWTMWGHLALHGFKLKFLLSVGSHLGKAIKGQYLHSASYISMHTEKLVCLSMFKYKCKNGNLMCWEWDV